MADSTSVIARKLQDFFHAKKIKQAEIARVTNTNKSDVCMFLNSHKPIGKAFAVRLAQYYGLSASYLLTGEGVLEPKQTDVAELSPITGNETPEHLDTIANEAKFALRNDEKAMLIDKLQADIADLNAQIAVLNTDNHRLQQSLNFAVHGWNEMAEKYKVMQKQLRSAIQQWSEATGVSKEELEAVFRAGSED